MAALRNPELLMRFARAPKGSARWVHQSRPAVSSESTWNRRTPPSDYGRIFNAFSHGHDPLLFMGLTLLLPSSPLIFGLLGLLVCVCVRVKYKVCFYLSVCQRCSNDPDIPSVFPTWFLHHPRIIRETHPPSPRPLATSPATFFSPVLRFRWIYTVLLSSSYNLHICVYGHFWTPAPPRFVQASDLFQRALYMCSEMGGCKKCWEMQLLIPLWKTFRCI